MEDAAVSTKDAVISAVQQTSEQLGGSHNKHRAETSEENKDEVCDITTSFLDCFLKPYCPIRSHLHVPKSNAGAQRKAQEHLTPQRDQKRHILEPFGLC